MNPMLVEFGAMKIPRAPPVRFRIACHWALEKKASAVVAADLVRITGGMGVALLCVIGLIGAATLRWPNRLLVLDVCDGCESEALHPAKSRWQQVAAVSTNPLVIRLLGYPHSVICNS